MSCLFQSNAIKLNLNPTSVQIIAKHNVFCNTDTIVLFWQCIINRLCARNLHISVRAVHITIYFETQVTLLVVK